MEILNIFTSEYRNFEVNSLELFYPECPYD